MNEAPALEFEISEDDWIALMRFQATRRGLLADVLRRNRFNSVWAGLVVLAAMAAWGYLQGRARPGGAIVLAGIYAAAFVPVWIVYHFWTHSRPRFERRWERHLRRAVARGHIPITLGRCRVSLDRSSMLLSMGATVSSMAWTSARAVHRTGDELFVEFADDVVVRIPSRAFSGAASSGDFQRALDQRLSEVGVHSSAPRSAVVRS